MSFKSRAAGVIGVVAVAAAAAAGGSGAQAPTLPSDCPTAPDPAALPSAAQLKQMNSFVAKLGVPPTGSRPHVRYINWIRQQLKTIPGIQTSDLDYKINRW